MRRPQVDRVLPLSAAVCALAVLVLSAGSAVRLIAAVALVLVLPGAALARAVLPGGERGPELIVAALGTSVAIVALAAIGFDVIGLRLEPTLWALGLFTLTLVGWRLCQRRPHPSVLAIYLGRDSEPARLWAARLRSSDALLVAAALAMTVGAVLLGTMPLRAPADTPGSSALWIEAEGTRRAVVVVRSGELGTRRYELFVSVDGRPAAIVPSFRLAPGEQRRVPAAPPFAQGARVEGLLYRFDRGGPHIYRRVELTLGHNVPAQAKAAKP